ncbi:hypothetical protein SLEP1_g8606 [Rubroshorea leprosula]|uniref:Uncharacterized protein n=1 Tax=Rubroshorea leprosula TaxID=152421 RepID=A0AAV5IC24_9ROSI|nr:hypothetical protein SLEP1_g8606 [Rubroshorea leprosula]
MSNKARGVPANAVARGPRGTRLIPKRGQIKSRIAVNAFHSIVSVLARASSHRYHSHRRSYLMED